MDVVEKLNILTDLRIDSSKYILSLGNSCLLCCVRFNAFCNAFEIVNISILSASVSPSFSFHNMPVSTPYTHTYTSVPTHHISIFFTPSSLSQHTHTHTLLAPWAQQWEWGGGRGGRGVEHRGGGGGVSGGGVRLRALHLTHTWRTLCHTITSK